MNDEELLKKIGFSFLFFVFLGLHIAKGQGMMFGIRYSGLAIHPKYNKNASIYKGKIDKKGFLVINRGLTLMVDVYVHKAFGIKVTQTILFSDCAGKLASMSHIGVNIGGPGYRLGDGKHALSASIGPMFFLRRTWYDVPGYRHDNYWLKESEDRRWARKLVWLGGQLEYNYYFSDRRSFSVNMLPGLPDVIYLSPGLNFR